MSQTQLPLRPKLTERAPPKRLRKRDRAATEARLLTAAEGVFSRYGFKAATTKLIATRSGVNEGLIGRYFSGKDGLLFALVEKRVSSSHRDSLPYEACSSVEKELVAYALFRLSIYRDDLAFFKIIVTQFLVDEKFKKRMRDLAPCLLNPELQSRLRKHLGRVGRSQLERVLEGLEIQIFGYLLMRVIMSGDPVSDAEAFLAAYARDCAKTLLNWHTSFRLP